MAPRDIVRSLSRTSVAIAALMTAVSVIVGVSIMIGSFRGTVVQLARRYAAGGHLHVAAIADRQSRGRHAGRRSGGRNLGWPGVAERGDRDGQRRCAVARHSTGRCELMAVDGDVSRGSRPYAWIRRAGDDVWAQLSGRRRHRHLRAAGAQGRLASAAAAIHAATPTRGREACPCWASPTTILPTTARLHGQRSATANSGTIRYDVAWRLSWRPGGRRG